MNEKEEEEKKNIKQVEKKKMILINNNLRNYCNINNTILLERLGRAIATGGLQGTCGLPT